MVDSVYHFKRTPGTPQAQSVAASPAVYTNSTPFIQVVVATGGVVTSLEVDQGSGFSVSGLLAGTFMLFPNWALRITYVVTPPTLTVQTI